MIPLDKFTRLDAKKTKKSISNIIIRGIGLLLAITAITFLAITIYLSWGEIQPSLGNVNGWLLIAGQLNTGIALLLGGIMWDQVQKTTGLGFIFRESLSIQFKSGITKYIPGYAWQYMSKGYLSRKHGASFKLIAYTMITELVLLILSGVTIASLGAWGFGYQWEILNFIPSWVWVGTTAIGLLGVIGWQAVSIKLNTIVRDHQSYIRLWIAFVIGMLGWLAFSGGTWLISRSLYPLGVNGYPQVVFAMVVSGIISIAVIIVPSGIGVREAALAFFLKGLLPFNIGSIVSILVRLSVIIAEVIAFAIALWATKK